MPQRIHILGTPVDNLSLEMVFEKIEVGLKNLPAGQIITANSLMVNAASQDHSLAQIFQTAYLVIPESAGISWAASFLSQSLIQRIAGIDLLFLICRQAEKKGWSIFLLGGPEGVAEKTKRKLTDAYPALKISGYHSGYFSPDEENALITQIKNLQPDLIFVGMSAPAQEKWINRHLKHFQHCLLMGVGGSFDVISGQLKRSPLFFQKTGLEWLYRLLRQPWRIGRILQLPVFVFRVVRQKYFAS
ncbi:MAG: WecB/TagA/CpsF family glycosyltransferase [Elusimicrobiota bacterium]